MEHPSVERPALGAPTYKRHVVNLVDRAAVVNDHAPQLFATSKCLQLCMCVCVCVWQ